MKDYKTIANSHIVYLLCSAVILFVLIQSIIFLVKSWKRGKQLGMSREKMLKAVKTSAVFSIVPSIPIVISLISIAPVLGIPFSWLRLSIVGSAPYELIAADIGAKSMGIEKLGADGYTGQVFANSMWVMTKGILWGLLMCIFFLKKYQNRMKNIKSKDSKWMTILINALFFGMLSVFIGPPIVKGGIALAVLASSAIIMTILTFIAKKAKLGWLNEFALSISMVGGMALAILYAKIM
jgi:hypothetical protein